MNPTVIALCVLLVGCASPPVSDTPSTSQQADDDPTIAPTPTPIATGVTFETCEQMHGFFPSPTAIFDGLTPAGFTLVTANGGLTTDVFVGWQFCETGSTTGSTNATFERPATFLAALQVVPPEEYGLPPATLDLLVLTWQENTVPVVGILEEWEMSGAEHAVVHLAGAGGGFGTRGRTYEASVSWGTFREEVHINDLTASNAATTYRGWSIGEPLGHVLVSNSPCGTVGTGAGALAFAGDAGAAPPLSLGDAHMVQGCDVTYAWTPLAT